ncbi:MAG: hypothetical protein ACYC3X_20050 [Pirellulaceae bacterium]
MLGYFDFFPEKTRTELRTAIFLDEDHGEGQDDSIPMGTYIFTEYFCTDPRCDCQRVLVKVLRAESESSRPEDVATISYTWNKDPNGIWSMLTVGMPNPFLDPFHTKTNYADELLDFWHDMVERDTAYADRIERHYHELRSAHPQPSDMSQMAPGTARRAVITTPMLTKPERRARKRRLEQLTRIRRSR